MTANLEKVLRSATIGLTDAAGKLLGTGFFVAPGLAITAAHVVDKAPDDRVYAEDSTGTRRVLTVLNAHPPDIAVGVDPYPLPDLAVLETMADDFADVPCALLGKPGVAPELVAYGFSRSFDHRVPYAEDVARFAFEGVREIMGTTVIKVKDSMVDEGMSGAPVLDPEAGTVVGFVKATRGEGKPYGAYLVAITELENFEHTVWARSALYHRTNATWRSARGGNVDGPDPVEATRIVVEGVAWTAEHRAGFLPDGVDVAALHQTVWLRRRDPADHSGGVGPSTRQRWRTERPLSGLTVVSGPPGLGKSWLLSHQASELAQQALAHLDGGGTVEGCTVPILLTCATLAAGVEAEASSRKLAQILVGAAAPEVQGDLDDGAGCVRAIERALTDGRLVVCLDGLDEMPTVLRSSLKLSLILLLARGNAVLIGTRPAALAIVDDVAVDNREDLELVGFSFRETVNFVRAWHAARPDAADALLGAVADRRELSQLAEVPLLLSFFSRLADPIRDTGYRPTALSQLYRDVAHHLLAGRWRTPTDREAMPDAVIRMRLLAAVLGGLQDLWRGGVEEIPKADLRAAMRNHPAYAEVASTAALRLREHQQVAATSASDLAEPVLWEFLHDGILVEATDARLRPMVRFIHPVVREVVLAEYFAGLPLDERLRCIDRHRWLDPGWVRVIVMAARVVDDPTALVGHIASVEEDPWVTQRLFAAEVIAEVETYSDTATATAVLDRVLTATTSPLSFERRRAIEALGLLMRSSCTVLRAWGRARVGGDGDSEPLERDVTHEVVASLVEVGDGAGIEVAHTLVASESCPQKVRARLIAGLVMLNTSASTDVVLSLLEGDSARRDDLEAFLAGLQPQSDVAVTAAVRLLRNRQLDTLARTAIGRALMECGPAGVDSVRAVADDRTENWSVRCRLYAEMLRAAVPGVATGAMRLLANRNPRFEDRAQITLALIEDGITDAIHHAAVLLSTGQVPWTFRESLARAVARLGNAGRDLLFNQVDDGGIPLDLTVRHVCALVEVNDQRGANVALTLHSDRGVPMRLRQTLADLLLRHDPTLADEDALIEVVTAPGTAINSRLSTVAEMLRRGFASAESALPSLIPESDSGLAALPDIFRRLAEWGPLARRTLGAIAQTSELDWATRCDAFLSLGGTDAVAARAVLAEEAVAEMPVLWRNRLSLGLARSGFAPDLGEFLDLAGRAYGGYRVLFEFLQRAELDAPTLERCVAAGWRICQEANRPGAAQPESGGFTLNAEFLKELGVEFRSTEEANQQLTWFYQTLEMRVGTRFARLLLTEQLDEFESYIDSNDEAGALDFLESEFPEYRAVVAEETEALKAAVQDGSVSMPRLEPREVSESAPLVDIRKTSAVLAEWHQYLVVGEWAKWTLLATQNHELISSPLALTLLDLSVAISSSWGPHEATFFVARQLSLDAFDGRILAEHSALLDWMKGRLDSGDFESMYLAAAFAAMRFPNEESSWFYAAVAAQHLGSDGLVENLLRLAGDQKPPAERERGAALLSELQSKFGWEGTLTERLIKAYSEGRTERPLSEYQRAAEREPGNAHAHYGFGIALQRADRHEEALAAYMRAAELQPDVMRYRRAQAGALAAAGRYEDALASIDAMLEVAGTDADAHALRGAILGDLGRSEDASLALQEAIRLAPSSASEIDPVRRTG